MKKAIICLFALIVTASQLYGTPQAIVFDFGGVMTGAANREIVVNLIRDVFHLTVSEFDQVNMEKRKVIKQGKSDEEFWIGYAKDRGIELPKDWTERFASAHLKAIGINPNMYTLVKELQDLKIPIGMLSNVDQRLARIIRDLGLYDPFDPCLLSCEIGVEKPHPKAYESLLKALNLPAEKVVFIDDLVENVNAAKALGIDAILFRSEQQLRKELFKRGIRSVCPCKVKGKLLQQGLHK